MVTPQALFCQFDRLTTHLRRRTVRDFSHRDDVLLLSDPNQFDRFSTGLSLLPMASMICFFSVRLASSSFASSLLASPSSKSMKLFRSRATWSSFPMPISLQHFSVWKNPPEKYRIEILSVKLCSPVERNTDKQKQWKFLKGCWMGCNKKQVAALDRRDQWLQLRGGDRAEQQLATGFLHVTNTQITRLPLTSSLTKQISHQQGEMWRNLLKLYIFGFSRLSTQNSQSMLSQLALNPWSTPPSPENRYT